MQGGKQRQVQRMQGGNRHADSEDAGRRAKADTWYAGRQAEQVQSIQGGKQTQIQRMPGGRQRQKHIVFLADLSRQGVLAGNLHILKQILICEKLPMVTPSHLVISP